MIQFSRISKSGYSRLQGFRFLKHNYKKLLIESLKEAALIRAGAKAARETTIFELTDVQKLEIDKRIAAYEANPSSGRL